MWEDEEIRSRRIQRLLIIVIAVLAAALLVGMKLMKAAEAKDNAELAEIKQEHQAELNAAKEANYTELYAAYDADLTSIAQNIPAIVCWGDSLTAGSSGNVSYPHSLQELIDENICEKYDFQRTLYEPKDYSRLTQKDWENFKIEIPVVNYGVPKEDSKTVLGRAGVANLVTVDEFTIPADRTAVDLKIQCPGGGITSLLANGDVGVNSVVINGVPGTLSIDQASYQYAINSYNFTRLEAGSEVTVPAGTEIICASADEYKDAVQVIWLGSYGGYADLDQLIEQQKMLINRQTANGDRYIVLGLYYLSLYGGGGYLDAFNQYEKAMAQEYGDHFINVRKYLATDAMTDAELTPTSTDKAQMSVGNVPDSLRNPSNYTELNATGYDLVGRLVYDRMMKLGYFDEVLDECGLKDIVK